VYATFQELSDYAHSVATSQHFVLTQHPKRLKCDEWGDRGWLKRGEVRTGCFKCNRAYINKSTGTGARVTKSIKRDEKSQLINCKCSINFVALRTGGYQFSTTNLEHSHAKWTEQEFLSASRKVSAETKKKASTLLQSGASCRVVKDILTKEAEQKNQSCPIIMKDLHNLNRDTQGKKAGTNTNHSRMMQFLDAIKQLGCEIQVIQNHQEDDIEVILIHTSQMNQTAELFGDFLLLDGTYNLTEMGWPVYIIDVVIGDNTTELVAIALVKDETTEILEKFISAFSKKITKKPTALMTDKDESLRSALKKVYPDSHLTICLFHMKAAVRKHITGLEKEMAKDERETILKIIDSMIHSSEEQQYLKYCDDLKMYCIARESCRDFFDTYFKPTWLNVQKEWAMCYTKKYGNIGNRTNNRTERLNREIKKEHKESNSSSKMKIESFVKFVASVEEPPIRKGS